MTGAAATACWRKWHSQDALISNENKTVNRVNFVFFTSYVKLLNHPLPTNVRNKGNMGYKATRLQGYKGNKGNRITG